MTIAPAIDGASTMREILEAFPGAQRALFRRYHIGGCSNCAFQPEESLEQVCARNGNLPVSEVLGRLTALELDGAVRRQDAGYIRALRNGKERA